ERVPSAHTIASPIKAPRLPSSQLTSVPCRVHACAMAGDGVVAARENTEIENRSARAIILPSPAFHCRYLELSPRVRSRFKPAASPDRPDPVNTLHIQAIGEIYGPWPALPCQIRPAPSREGIRRDGRVA